VPALPADPISAASRLDPRLASKCGLGLEADLQEAGFALDIVGVSSCARGPPSLRACETPARLGSLGCWEFSNFG